MRTRLIILALTLACIPERTRGRGAVAGELDRLHRAAHQSARRAARQRPHDAGGDGRRRTGPTGDCWRMNWRTRPMPGPSSRAGRPTARRPSSAAGGRAPTMPAGRKTTSSSASPPKAGCYDSYLVTLSSGQAENVTAVDRVSFYNSGLFFWPNDAGKLGFTALIDGNSHPFRMDRDGRNKTDLTQGVAGIHVRLQRDARRKAHRVPQGIPGVPRQRRRLECPPDRNRPTVQLRTDLVARRRVGAFPLRRTLQLSPSRRSRRRLGLTETRRPRRLQRCGRVPGRSGLSRRQQ